MTYYQVRAGGCFLTEESDRLKARGSDCAASRGNMSGGLHHCPQAEEQHNNVKEQNWLKKNNPLDFIICR